MSFADDNYVRLCPVIRIKQPNDVETVCNGLNHCSLMPLIDSAQRLVIILISSIVPLTARRDDED